MPGVPRSAGSQALLDSLEGWDPDEDDLDGPTPHITPVRSMGRPRQLSEEQVRVQFQADPEHLAVLDDHAKKKGISRSAMIRHLIETLEA